MRIPTEEPITPTTRKASLYIADTPTGSPITLEMEIEHHGPEFTTTGAPIIKRTVEMVEITEYDRLSISGSSAGRGGQIQDYLRKDLDALKLKIPREKLVRILDIWDAYHLNDLQGGCVHQTATRDAMSKQENEITITSITLPWDIYSHLTRQFAKDVKQLTGAELTDKQLKDPATIARNRNHSSAAKFLDVFNQLHLQPFTKVVIDKAQYRELTRKCCGWREEIEPRIAPHRTQETKSIWWVSPDEDPRGQLGRKCLSCGYAYGSAWLVGALPTEVQAEIIELFQTPTPVPVQPIDAFIDKHGIAYTCQNIKERPDRHDFTDPGARHFKVRFQKGRRSLTIYFSQGSAHTEPPTAADVLSCLKQDFAGFEGQQFEQWARDLGYEPDSRKAEGIYKTIKRQARQLKHTIGPDAYAELLKTEVD